jgi:lipoate---protein ligase
VGAVSRCGLLTQPTVPSVRPFSPFDVEQFRPLRQRRAVAHEVAEPTVVLGSTQRPEIVDAERARASGTAVVRRRGGGGAVALQPGDHVWIEAWIPRDDPLWEADVAAAAGWVGEWWSAALCTLMGGAGRCTGTGTETGTATGGGTGGNDGLVVHRGKADPGRHGSLVCFSGRGPGEVFHDGRKVMGVSQWRSREGALFHTCAYTHWDPGPLVELFDFDPWPRRDLLTDLDVAAIGVADLIPGLPGAALTLRDSLLGSFPKWGGE